MFLHDIRLLYNFFSPNLWVMDITERCSKYVISVKEVLLPRRQKLLLAWVQERRLNQERYFNLNEILIATFLSSMEDDKDCKVSLTWPTSEFQCTFQHKNHTPLWRCRLHHKMYNICLKGCVVQLDVPKIQKSFEFWFSVCMMYHIMISCNWGKSEPNGVKCEIFSIWSIAYNSICVRWRQE